MQLLLHDSSRKGTFILHHCIPPGSFRYARAIMGYMELGSRYLWGQRIICLEGERDHDVGQQKRTMSCSRVGKEGGRLWGGELRGSWRARLLPTEGRSAGPSTFASVFWAPWSSCLLFQSSFWFILWWSSSLLRMYAHQVFLALFTGVLNTIACVCRRGVSGIFPAGLRLAFVSSVRDSFGQWKCLPIFYRGLMCMCCVCVCMHTHTHCMWGTRTWARVSARDTWRAWKKSRCTVVIAYIFTVRCTKYTCIYICCATGRSLD